MCNTRPVLRETLHEARQRDGVPASGQPFEDGDRRGVRSLRHLPQAVQLLPKALTQTERAEAEQPMKSRHVAIPRTMHAPCVCVCVCVQKLARVRGRSLGPECAQCWSKFQERPIV